MTTADPAAPVAPATDARSGSLKASIDSLLATFAAARQALEKPPMTDRVLAKPATDDDVLEKLRQDIHVLSGPRAEIAFLLARLDAAEAALAAARVQAEEAVDLWKAADRKTDAILLLLDDDGREMIARAEQAEGALAAEKRAREEAEAKAARMEQLAIDDQSGTSWRSQVLKAEAESADVEFKLTAAEARIAALREALEPEPAWLENDEQLADEFHAELKRQRAFSLEHDGKIALGMHPFIMAVWRAVRRAALTTGGTDAGPPLPHPITAGVDPSYDGGTNG